MVSSEARLINSGYGRGVASLRALASMSQLKFAEALTAYYTDEDGVVAFPMTQTKLSEIENGKQPLKAHEIEMLVTFLSVTTGLEEEEVRRRLRPHGLSLVRGSYEATSADSLDQEGGSTGPLLRPVAA